MLDFQKKVEILRGYESLCYTVCVTLLIDEQAACKMAEETLCQLFSDQDFWLMNETERPSYILRLCKRGCLQWTRVNLLQTS
ncbi:hypothetical protein A7975_03770 [Bacillus sp. FJAT-26390]|nr:hypothetical protein A7975_03770 [Bacillus sp. FJAT-26390]